MERQYDKMMRLLKSISNDLYELKDLLSQEQQHDITEDETKALSEEILRFTVAIKEFQQ